MIDKNIRNEINAVLKDFDIDGVEAVEPFGEGHINFTFKVTTQDGEYILQKVDTDIFADFDGMMDNICRVCEHLANKGNDSLKVIAYKMPWRLYNFVKNTYSIYVLDNPELAYRGAKAFAQFQNYLADLPEPRLNETIPRFHDLRDRVRLFDEAVEADKCGRASQARDTIDFYSKRRGYKDRILGAMEKGLIPERITHNDTKINNVLFDKDTDEVTAVCDLDTVMPGCALYDFGDMVRSATASAEEDETDLSKVFSKPEYFGALVRGYLSEAKFLNKYELENLAFSGLALTYTIGIRFLTDYLAGDEYFATEYDTHNLDRARNQAKMCESLEEQMDDYEAIVDKVATELGF